MIASALYWTVAVTLFAIAWAALALLVGLVYVRLCRLADRRLAEEREMRQILTAIGRERQEAHLAEMIANADALVAEVNDARAVRRILRDVRRAPVLAEATIDRLPEVG